MSTSSGPRRAVIQLSCLLSLSLLAACQGSAPAGDDRSPTPGPPTGPTVAPTPTRLPGPYPVSPAGLDGQLATGTDGLPWWNDTVFYEIFVRSYQDSDGDGIGDLAGLIERLDYLNDGDPATTEDLGITGIWLMPIMEAPAEHPHGYHLVDYRTVERDYGSNDDFKRLLDEAHARGIRVIIDLVLNHTAAEHPWFQEALDPASPRRDWYVWADEDPGYRGPDNQRVWHQAASGYYYGVFNDLIPDLNLANPVVTAELEDITRFWLEEMGVDGFRLDAIKFLIANGRAQESTAETYAWLADYYQYYKGVRPEALTVGEAWAPTSLVVRYVGDKVDIAFEFDLAVALLTSAREGLNIAVSRQLAEVVAAFPPHQYGVFLANHDQNRVMSALREDPSRARVAASMLLTAPGVPFLYYGEEIGMVGVKPDPQLRRPMQWTGELNRAGFTTGIPWYLLDGSHRTVNVAAQTGDPESLLSHYRRLIRLRQEHEALRVGDWLPVESDSIRLLAYLRHSDQEFVLVLINLSDRPVPAEDYALVLESGPLAAISAAYDLWTGEALSPPALNDGGGFGPYQPLATVPPYSTMIIQLQP